MIRVGEGEYRVLAALLKYVNLPRILDILNLQISMHSLMIR